MHCLTCQLKAWNPYNPFDLVAVAFLMPWNIFKVVCFNALSYIFFSLHNRSNIFVRNIYNLLAHVPSMDFQKESTFDMWSTVGEYFIICLAL